MSSRGLSIHPASARLKSRSHSHFPFPVPAPVPAPAPFRGREWGGGGGSLGALPSGSGGEGRDHLGSPGKPCTGKPRKITGEAQRTHRQGWDQEQSGPGPREKAGVGGPGTGCRLRRGVQSLDQRSRADSGDIRKFDHEGGDRNKKTTRNALTSSAADRATPLAQ